MQYEHNPVPTDTMVFFVHPIKHNGQRVYALDYRQGEQALPSHSTPVAVADIHMALNRALHTTWILARHTRQIHGQVGFGRLINGELTTYERLSIGVELMISDELTRRRLKRQQPER